MTDNFLPDNYEVPAGPNKYMKFKLGENKIRILSSPILGYEYWKQEKEGKKPYRITMDTPITMDMVDEKDNMPKHFWALVVWNYNEKAVQILEITQKGILKSLRALAKSEKWGSPKGYDITITREGEGFETEYSLQPDPKSEVDPEIMDKFTKTYINLNALFEGKDPFKKE
jgi:hypothetical protein